MNDCCDEFRSRAGELLRIHVALRLVEYRGVDDIGRPYFGITVSFCRGLAPADILLRLCLFRFLPQVHFNHSLQAERTLRCDPEHRVAQSIIGGGGPRCKDELPFFCRIDHRDIHGLRIFLAFIEVLGSMHCPAFIPKKDGKSHDKQE